MLAKHQKSSSLADLKIRSAHKRLSIEQAKLFQTNVLCELDSFTHTRADSPHTRQMLNAGGSHNEQDENCSSSSCPLLTGSRRGSVPFKRNRRRGREMRRKGKVKAILLPHTFPKVTGDFFLSVWSLTIQWK